MMLFSSEKKNCIKLTFKSNEQIGWGVQPNSEYVDAVNFHLAKLDESGVTYRLWQLWTYQPLEEFGVEDAISLGYDNIIFPFFFLFFGIPGGALISLLEWLRSLLCGKSKQEERVFAPRRGRNRR